MRTTAPSPGNTDSPPTSRAARASRWKSWPIPCSASVLAGRLDLRHLPFITIDPASARDHDDALYAEARPRHEAESFTQRLWIAIADVSHFVAAGSFVDAEARRRGNSFYFPDRAIPMLPERLSSELCSLRPDEDRLVLAVELRLSAEGEILDALFHEAVIRSHAKLSYEQAADWLEGSSAGPGPGIAPDPGRLAVADGEAAAWHASLILLAAIATRLGERRRNSGSIELELPEVEIAVDAAGRPIDAVLRRRNPAHGLVEEAMLAANQAVAKALERARSDTLHRVHPAPDPRRLEELGRLLERFGLPDADDLEEPGAIAAMLQAVRGLALAGAHSSRDPALDESGALRSDAREVISRSSSPTISTSPRRFDVMRISPSTAP